MPLTLPASGRKFSIMADSPYCSLVPIGCTSNMIQVPDSSVEHLANLAASRRKGNFGKRKFKDGLGASVSIRTKNDNKPGTSVEDSKFIDIMKTSLTKGVLGNWEAPLTLRKGIENLPIIGKMLLRG